MAWPTVSPFRFICNVPTGHLGRLCVHSEVDANAELELEDLVAAGLTPLAAITAATSEAARVLGADAEIGTVAVGKRADLILLDADPLEDIRNTRRIRMVIQRGRIVDRGALLQSAREQTKPNPALAR